MAERDMTQLSAVKGLAAWIGKGSGALVVMVLRGAAADREEPDCACWMAADLAPEAGVAAVEAALPELLLVARTAREERRARAAEKASKRDVGAIWTAPGAVEAKR
jgi:hypothetical protein